MFVSEVLLIALLGCFINLPEEDGIVCFKRGSFGFEVGKSTQIDTGTNRSADMLQMLVLDRVTRCKCMLQSLTRSIR